MALHLNRTPTLLTYIIQSRIKLSSVLKRTAYFPLEYQDPIINKKALKELEESPEFENLKYQPFLPAPVSVNSSVFYNDLKERFVRYIMTGGKKMLARDLLEKTFYEIKRIQLNKYFKAETESEKDEIECNPFIILETAVENCTPILTVKPIKRGGTLYQVPIPLAENRANYLSIKWILEAARDKGTKVSLPAKLSKELIDAYYNEGRVIKKKQDLHKLCEANKAYAHFRWG